MHFHARERQAALFESVSRVLTELETPGSLYSLSDNSSAIFANYCLGSISPALNSSVPTKLGKERCVTSNYMLGVEERLVKVQGKGTKKDS